jgi:hypothetical protein
MRRLLALALASGALAVAPRAPVPAEDLSTMQPESFAPAAVALVNPDQNPLGSSATGGNNGSLDVTGAVSAEGLSLPSNWTGCGTDAHGVPGGMCSLVCECGSRTCPEIGGAEVDFSRCYIHDPILATSDDECGRDVGCCIPAAECSVMCTVQQQEDVNLLMLAFVNASDDTCETLFALQLHGIAQDEYELCICIKKAIDKIEEMGTIAEYNSAVEALNLATCRMTNGQMRTIYDITLMCMSTDVVGDPFLAVGEEKIKFFFPPGEMVDLLTWRSPSGKHVQFRGMTFQQKGAAHSNTARNVQWFQKFEILLANTSVLSITSFHAYDPYAIRKPGQDPVSASVLALASPDESDPNFTEEHKSRKTFIGVKLDGRDIFCQPHTLALAQYQSIWAGEIGLKLTAVQTKEHKIGGELAEKVDVVTDKFKFRVWSSKAGKFFDPKLQIEYAHLNLNMMGAFPANVGGFFAELRGKAPMSARSASYLRKVDVEPTARVSVQQELAIAARRAMASLR